jgi:hypothetical protein
MKTKSYYAYLIGVLIICFSMLACNFEESKTQENCGLEWKDGTYELVFEAKKNIKSKWLRTMVKRSYFEQGTKLSYQNQFGESVFFNVSGFGAGPTEEPYFININMNNSDLDYHLSFIIEGEKAYWKHEKKECLSFLLQIGPDYKDRVSGSQGFCIRADTVSYQEQYDQLYYESRILGQKTFSNLYCGQLSNDLGEICFNENEFMPIMIIGQDTLTFEKVVVSL